jgi:hypothetical protein
MPSTAPDVHKGRTIRLGCKLTEVEIAQKWDAAVGMRESSLKSMETLRVLCHDVPDGGALLATLPSIGTEALIDGLLETFLREIQVKVVDHEKRLVIDQLEEHARAGDKSVSVGVFGVGIVMELGRCDEAGTD